MLTDIEIAQQTKLIPIDQLAHEYGLSDDQFIPYGRDKAKVALDTSNAKGKLILVTATSGMPAGSGKTTTSIAVAQAFKKLGEKACLALREPSLGPSFGMKGGAAGGGYSQVVPMESINLHFTGDFHAITAANNLLAALIDNARHQGQVDLKEITWRRVLDVNDRMLRNIVTGLGGPANGIPTETGFDITAASELMAIICLADGEEDLRTRLDRLVVGLKRDGSAYTCKELGATGALMAHGCNSVAATRAAMTIADWAITEAGFGSDLGAEKFYDIKCRMNNLQPAATILVTSLRALKWHGGVPLPEIGKENMDALINGLPNLKAHIASLKRFGQQVVVSLNHFANDNEEEIDVVRKECLAAGVRFAISDGFAKGGEGALDVAREVMAAVKEGSKPLNYAYSLDESIEEKIQDVNTKVYGGQDVSYSSAALKDLAKIKALNMGFEKLPICIAKTPFSMSHDPDLKGAPHGFTLPVQRVILNAGAGFLVVTTGAIMRMPGLPKKPAAYTIDVVGGKITGLS